MNKKTIQDIDVSGKRCLVRVDYNVPLDEESGQITDDARIRETLPTLRHLLDSGAAIVLMAHFGRPQGQSRGVNAPGTGRASLARTAGPTRRHHKRLRR
jgi:3-phosphoglycerate kinase